MSGLEAHFRLTRQDFTLDARFSAPETGVTGLFGRSGSGKTTILRLVAGLERPEKGWLTLSDRVWQDEGRFMKPHLRPVGYVFQDARLFPHLDVAGNLEFAIKRAGPSETPAHRDEVVSLLGLDDLLTRRVTVLSGGEKQRVAIARALLSHPRLLLMDEPLASLDRDSRREILPYLERLTHQLQVPMLYVSHDLTEIERFTDHLVLLAQGSVLAAGPTATLVADPKLPLARDREATVRVEIEISDHDIRHALTIGWVGPHRIYLPGVLGASGEKRRLIVRAGDVSLTLERPEKSSILNILPCNIETMEEVEAGQVVVVLTLEGTQTRLLARLATKSRDALMLAPGLSVFAQIKGMALVDKE